MKYIYLIFDKKNKRKCTHYNCILMRDILILRALMSENSTREVLYFFSRQHVTSITYRVLQPFVA